MSGLNEKMGKAAYEAFLASLESPPPFAQPWERMPQVLRDAWTNAARKVLELAFGI